MKKMNLSFFIFLLLVLLNADLYGQTDFRPGYIITNNNDTLQGLIDYRGDYRNSKVCNFKNNESSPATEYKPFEIKGYRYTDSKFYISKEIFLNQEKAQLFLEFLVNGIADLYYCKDANNFTHYFLETSIGNFYELTNEEIQLNVGNRTFTRESKDYIGILRYAFSDCPSLFPEIDRSELDTKPLIGLTKKYHDIICNDGKCVVYQKQMPPVKVKWGPFAGFNTSLLKFADSYFFGAVDFPYAYYPSIGLQLVSEFPKLNEKLSFQASIELSKSKFQGDDSKRIYSSGLVEMKFETMNLKSKAGIKYTYPKGKIRPTVTIGANSVYVIKRDEEKSANAQFSESKDFARLMFGYDIDLGMDFLQSSKFTPFINLGYSYSFGSNSVAKFNPVYQMYEQVSTTVRTLGLKAGFYF